MQALFPSVFLLIAVLLGSTYGESDSASSSSHSSSSSNESSSSSSHESSSLSNLIASSASSHLKSYSSSSSHCSGSGGDHGHHAWWAEDYQYNFIEELALIILVVLAMCFDLAWHTITHGVEGSYRYGDLYDKIYYENEQDSEHPHEAHHDHFLKIDFHGNFVHHRLLKELGQRVGTEFMTLGFLAFVVFGLNQFEFFDFLAEHITGENIPQTQSDWLHVVEEVHMKLFVAMILYFVLVARIIKGSLRKLRDWEQAMLRNLSAARPGAHSCPYRDEKLSQYRLWNEYLIKEACAWHQSHPELFTILCHRLDIEDESEDAEEELKAALHNRFVLAGYLAASVESGVEDSIEIHPATWCGLLFLLALFAVAHKFAKITLVMLSPIFAGCTLVILVCTWLVDRYMTSEIKTAFMADNEKQILRQAGTFSEQGRMRRAARASFAMKEMHIHWKSRQHSASAESYLFRNLQMGLFLNCYLLSQAIINKPQWQNHPEMNLLLVVIEFLKYFMIMFTLPILVPRFLAMRSLPPYMTSQDMAACITHLIDDRVQRIRDTLGDNTGKSSPMPTRTISDSGMKHTLSTRSVKQGQLKIVNQKIQALDDRVSSIEKTMSGSAQQLPCTQVDIEVRPLDDRVASIEKMMSEVAQPLPSTEAASSGQKQEDSQQESQALPLEIAI